MKHIRLYTIGIRRRGLTRLAAKCCRHWNSCRLAFARGRETVVRPRKRRRCESSYRNDGHLAARRGGRSRRITCLRRSERRGIFPQHSGGRDKSWFPMATIRRTSNSHWRFATRGDRLAQIGTRCVTTTVRPLSLAKFLKQYPPRPYCRRSAGGSDYPAAELAPVTSDDGLMCLNKMPKQPPLGTPRQSHKDHGVNCHLWVVDERGLPCISHEPLKRLGSGELHHTNLTGGSKASIGGEVWFGALPLIYLSGSSGRYPPKDHGHLKDAEQLFRAVGFDVRSLGWDPETHRPLRVWLDR